MLRGRGSCWRQESIRRRYFRVAGREGGIFPLRLWREETGGGRGGRGGEREREREKGGVSERE